jgi:hypothetical protein
MKARPLLHFRILNFIWGPRLGCAGVGKPSPNGGRCAGGSDRALPTPIWGAPVKMLLGRHHVYGGWSRCLGFRRQPTLRVFKNVTDIVSIWRAGLQTKSDVARGAGGPDSRPTRRGRHGVVGGYIGLETTSKLYWTRWCEPNFTASSPKLLLGSPVEMLL